MKSPQNLDITIESAQRRKQRTTMSGWWRGCWCLSKGYVPKRLTCGCRCRISANEESKQADKEKITYPLVCVFCVDRRVSFGSLPSDWESADLHTLWVFAFGILTQPDNCVDNLPTFLPLDKREVICRLINRPHRDQAGEGTHLGICIISSIAIDVDVSGFECSLYPWKCVATLLFLFFSHIFQFLVGSPFPSVPFPPCFLLPSPSYLLR